MGSEQCREKAQQGWEYGGTSAGWRRERQGCGLGGGSGEQRESLLDGGFLNICHPEKTVVPEAPGLRWDSSPWPNVPLGWCLAHTGAQDFSS